MKLSKETQEIILLTIKRCIEKRGVHFEEDVAADLPTDTSKEILQAYQRGYERGFQRGIYRIKASQAT